MAEGPNDKLRSKLCSEYTSHPLYLKFAPLYVEIDGMAYAILRTEKLKTFGNIAGSAAHTYRRGEMAPNADVVLQGKNRTLVGRPDQVLEDVKDRIAKITDKPRANAVLCVEYMLTASPEFFKGLTAKQLDIWTKRNLQFLAKTYGKENVVHAVLHMDETTPHIVAYVVPEKDGKLNCRAYLGGREKLTQHQDDYAEDMRSMKLIRGVKGSKATHQAVKSFYTAVNKIDPSARAKIEELKKPIEPPHSLLGLVSKEVREEELKVWAAKEVRRTTKLVEAAGQAITAAVTLKEENTVLKTQNSALEASMADLRARMSELAAQLALPKDEIAKLRKLNISAVADRLSFFGEVNKGENAIDLVKRVNGFEYAEAVAWLHSEFGSAGAAAAVREHLEVAKPARPLTNSEKAISKAVHQQLDALSCDSFRISLIDRDGVGAPYLPGKSGGVERFYSRGDVENLVPYLRYENNNGRHVFVTPMDDDAYYVLLDDLRKDPTELMKTGFQPCLVQATSWNSIQAVFKVPKSQVTNRQAVVDVFNEMNREMGDTSITGLRHPMRLAGFRNMKPKHEHDGKFPFVKVLYATNQFCRKTLDRILRRQQQLEPKPVVPVLRRKADEPPPPPTGFRP